MVPVETRELLSPRPEATVSLGDGMPVLDAQTGGRRALGVHGAHPAGSVDGTGQDAAGQIAGQIAGHGSNRIDGGGRAGGAPVA